MRRRRQSRLHGKVQPVIRLPYRPQETDWTCGPACLRMLLAARGIRVSERRLAAACNTTAAKGTSPRDLARAARAWGCVLRLSARLRIADLRRLLARGVPVVVNYREPSEEVGHYAVAVALGPRTITLQDPCNGRHFRLPIAAFRRRWYGHENRSTNGGRGLFQGVGTGVEYSRLSA